MKKMKKAMALLLAMVMALAMNATVFATGNDAPVNKTLTINNPATGHTYTAYQILSGVVDGDQLTNLNWGTGITDDGKSALKAQLELGDGATVAQVADALSKIDNDSAAMDAVAQILGDNKDGDGVVLTVGEDGKATASVAQGYYVIIDTRGEGADPASTVSKYMVRVADDVAINTKAKDTTSQKTLQEENDAKAKFTETNIGKEETFYLLATLPDDYAAYDSFYMEFIDTMHHMDYVSLTGVTVKKDVITEEKNGKTVYDPATGTVVKTLDPQNGTAAINGYELTLDPSNIPEGDAVSSDVESRNLTIRIADLKQVCPDAVAGNCVIVEYKAKLNGAAVANTAEKNEFELKFSNNPNNKFKPTTPGPQPEIPTGITPKDEVELYTTELELLKQDGTTHDILTGAEFTLVGNTNNVRIETKTEFKEATDGEYWKLKNGTYTKDAPNGNEDLYDSTTKKYKPETNTNVVATNPEKTNIKAYVGEDGKVKFTGLGVGHYTLKESQTPEGYNTMADKEFDIIFNPVNKTFSASDGFSLVATIDNYSGSELPSTGGIGTTIFYIVGAVLVIGAAILLVTKKRMSKEA